MRGFKSFGPRKVRVPLAKGLTVITGPNGAGKSNVFDAVRFVLGELSARSLRASKFAEVIYDGGQSAEKAKSAWVSVEFDNADRKIPIDADSVVISRMVHADGQSVYRLNGRKIPRIQLTDALTVPGLTSTGHNMIMQGTITRLADIAPVDRRKLIEDIIGIADYDRKKAEAEAQLQQAEINLRVATARIDEVQQRLESLERERNDALRYNFIKGEIARLEATKISFEIGRLRVQVDELTSKLAARKAEADRLRAERDRLQTERDQVELDRRRFDEEVADKGSARLVSLQKEIGDASVDIARLRTEIESSRMTLLSLVRVRDERREQIESLRKSIGKSKKALNRVERELGRATPRLEERKKTLAQINERLKQLKDGLKEKTEKIESIENRLYEIGRSLVGIDTGLKGSVAKSRILLDNLRGLESRKESFESTLKSLEKHEEELKTLRKTEQENLKRAMDDISAKTARKEALLRELLEGEVTAERARSAVVEFETQKSFAEKIAAEEDALRKIEEMGRIGAIPGVYGRLKRLIAVRPEHRRPIEAASMGWLKAVVVRDLETALRCVESLKKMKIGRVKLIPLRDVASAKPVEAPKIEGVIGPVTELIRCRSKRFTAAVNFVFGDTIVTSGEKSALLTSKAGYRSVDMSGDVYEPWGGMESGFFRTPIDLSAIIPRDSAVMDLDQSVKALQSLLRERRKDIEVLDSEVQALNEDRVRKSDVIEMLERETGEVSENAERARRNIRVIEKRLARLNKDLAREKEISESLERRKSDLNREAESLRAERKSLRLMVRPATIVKFEGDQTQLNSEINDLQRDVDRLGSEARSLRSNLESAFLPELGRSRIAFRNVESQIDALQKKIENSSADLAAATMRLSDLERVKEELAGSLVTVKDERRRFEEKLDKVDRVLREIDGKYEPASSGVHQLELQVQGIMVELRHMEERLHGLGYAEPLLVTAEDLGGIESSLRLMSFELERLGSVNQLATVQYDAQKDNYKQLSTRRNQLEEERRSIVQFMEEIERKKREAFGQAYNQVNGNFMDLFGKLTGGGSGWLQLENPEDPFAGGLDIFVQFPGKAARLVSGASGGEKSVAAVSFIFALQRMQPAAFYIFDEIDAHLDPYNAERLADLLKSQAGGSQFIVITLRDVIVDRAESLFGVYVQDGVSRVVSIRIPEIVA